jgi:hypothetical protein
VITVTRTLRAQALFVSCLQPSDRPTPAQVAAAIRATLRSNQGPAGCAALLAAEYGDHPDAAAARMRWALAMVAADAASASAPTSRASAAA